MERIYDRSGSRDSHNQVMVHLKSFWVLDLLEARKDSNYILWIKFYKIFSEKYTFDIAGNSSLGFSHYKSLILQIILDLWWVCRNNHIVYWKYLKVKTFKYSWPMKRCGLAYSALQVCWSLSRSGWTDSLDTPRTAANQAPLPWTFPGRTLE